MSGPAPPPTSRASAADLIVVRGQLGRRPHELQRIAARCPFGWPAAVEDLPYDAKGRPFPTLYYLTCPTLVAGVGRLESAGGVRAWTARLEVDSALARSLREAAAVTRRRRRTLALRLGRPMADGGASLRTGVGGVHDVRAVKCLHAHVAHALAHPTYAFGAAVLAEVEDPWCADRRCAALAGPDGGEP